MDVALFVMMFLATGVAAAAILLPSEGRRPHHWDEDELRNQLDANR